MKTTHENSRRAKQQGRPLICPGNEDNWSGTSVAPLQGQRAQAARTERPAAQPIVELPVSEGQASLFDPPEVASREDTLPASCPDPGGTR